MAEHPSQPKTLEMRVAELEDKLSKLHISEEEMKTYQKVAAALGGGGMAPQQAPMPPVQAMPQVQALPQYYSVCRYYQPCYYQPCYYRVCYYQADCIGPGPMSPMGGSFGSFGG